MNISTEHAYGALLGMLVGDAAGASLEFTKEKITEQVARNAMHMPGGGQLHIGPGQITDDGELALSLALALGKNDPKDDFPEEDIFYMYHQWFKSNPFDVGFTCRLAFADPIPRKNYELPRVRWSESNGALMRITPLAIWAAKEDYKTIAKFAANDADLSHPNQICKDCNIVYCIAIAYLLRHPGDYIGCVALLEEYVKQYIQSRVKVWFYESKEEPEDCEINAGHVRWAFRLALFHLRNNTPYETAIIHTLMKGGDTDTNAAIVGGLIGALHGQKMIPEYMLKPVLEFDCTRSGNKGYIRPDIYSTKYWENIAHNLISQP
jgi:ADP-ribosyl-[dinitrogen reductase] hydrolase